MGASIRSEFVAIDPPYLYSIHISRARNQNKVTGIKKSRLVHCRGLAVFTIPNNNRHNDHLARPLLIHAYSTRMNFPVFPFFIVNNNHRFVLLIIIHFIIGKYFRSQTRSFYRVIFFFFIPT